MHLFFLVKMFANLYYLVKVGNLHAMKIGVLDLQIACTLCTCVRCPYAKVHEREFKLVIFISLVLFLLANNVISVIHR